MSVHEHAPPAMGPAALRWAARGKPVLPVSERKQPLTRHGLLDASTDPWAISEWWRRWPTANVAIRTGAPSGLVVLDADAGQGADALHELERRHGQLPTTTSVATPRGGAHYYFRHPGEEIKTTAGVIAPGVDIRGDGGYVLVPPSAGASGRRYDWDETAPPAPMPGWLVAATKATATAAQKAVPVETWLGVVRDGLREGERNNGLARLVGHLLARDVDARLVAELAHLVNARSRPPLTTAEVDRVVASIAGREVRRRLEGSRR
jgi:hypothetical protein